MIRKTIPSIIAVFLLCLAFASYAHCALVGRVSLAEGRVDVLKSGRSNLTPVKTGDPVDVGDVYRVKSDGRAEIKFTDGGMIRIAPSSRIEIKDYSSDARKTNNIIRLSTGHVQVISGKTFVQKVSQFVEGNRFEVHTPNAVAGIRGSNMIVSFARSVTSTMFVDGKGYQYNPADTTKTQVNIVKGQISFVSAGSPPTPPRKATPAEAASIIKTVTVTPKSSSGTGTTTSSTSENKSTASSGSGSTNNKGSSGSTSTASSGSGNSSGSTGSSGSAGANTMTSSGSIGSTNTGTTFITSAMATTTPAGMSQTTTPAVMQNTLAGTTLNTLPDIPVTQTTGATTTTATTPETPLTVNLTSTPPALTNSASAAFQIEASEPSTFSYSTDGGTTWVGTGSTLTIPDIPEGSHTVSFRATDTYGRTATQTYTWTTDYTAPVVSIPTKPSLLNNSTSAGFGFSATDATSVNYQYSTDGGATWVSTGSTLSFTGLTEGSHNLMVKGTDGAGNSSTQTYSWTTDYTAPVVSIPTKPSLLNNSTSAGFGFSATDATSVNYQYSTDGGATWVSTGSTLSLTGLTEGSHSLMVKGTDGAGNSSTQTYSWTTDYTAPIVSIPTKPSPFNNSTSAGFGFSATDATSVNYQYSTDGGTTWVSTGSTLSLTGLTEGSHNLMVKGTDGAGNSSTQTYSWTTDYTAPIVSIPTKPSLLNNSTSAGFGFSATDATSVNYQYSTDGGTTWVSTGSTLSLTGLTEGSHNLMVKGTDGAGNSSTQTYTWTTDYTSPAISSFASSSTPIPGAATAGITVNTTTGESTNTTYSLDGGAYTNVSGTSFTAGDVPAGSHTLSFKAIDAAGNESDVSALSFTLNRYSLTGNTSGTGSTMSGPVTDGNVAEIQSQNWGSWVIPMTGTYSGPSSPSWQTVSGGTINDMAPPNTGYWLSKGTGSYSGSNMTGTSNFSYITRTTLGTGTGTITGSNDGAAFTLLDSGGNLAGSQLTSVSNLNASRNYLQNTGELTASGTTAAGSYPVSVAIEPTMKFAYVANGGANNISIYTINQSTGALTAAGTVAAGTSPQSIAIEPTGRFAYVANNDSNNVSVYTINQTTGALTAGGIVAAGTNPRLITVDPTGKFAYVTNEGSNNVSVYTINQTTGALTAGGTVATGSTPATVAVDPTGKFAYVTNSGSNDISIYTVNQTTGALTAAGTVVAAGNTPHSIAVDPTGKFAYVTNYTSNTISVYTINQTTGALTAGTTIATGSDPNSVAVDPTGKFVYVTNGASNTIFAYTINQSTGALTAGTTIATGSGPDFVAIDPTGKFVYATNYTSNTVSVFSIARPALVADGSYNAYMGSTSSLWTATALLRAPLTLIGTYSGTNTVNHTWMTNLSSYNYSNSTDTTYDGGAYKGYMGGIHTGNTMAAKLAALYIDPSGNAGYLKGNLQGTGYPDISMFEMAGSAYPTQMATAIGITPANLSANTLEYNQVTGANNNIIDGSFGGSGSLSGKFSTSTLSITNYGALTAQNWGIYNQIFTGNLTIPGGSTIWSAVANSKASYGIYALSTTNHETYTYPEGIYVYNYFSSGANDGVSGFISYRNRETGVGYNVSISKTNKANANYTATYRNYAYDQVGKYWYHTSDAQYSRTGNITSSASLNAAEQPPAGWSTTESGIGSRDMSYGITSISGDVASGKLTGYATGSFIGNTLIGTTSGDVLASVVNPGETAGDWQGISVGSWSTDPLSHISAIRANMWHSNDSGSAPTTNGYISAMMGSKDSAFGSTSTVRIIGDYEAVDRTKNRVLDAALTSYNSIENRTTTYDGGAYRGYLVGLSIPGATDTIKARLYSLYKDSSTGIGYLRGPFTGTGYHDIFALEMTGTISKTPMGTTSLSSTGFYSSFIENTDVMKRDNHFISGTLGAAGSISATSDLAFASINDLTNNVAQDWGIFKLTGTGTFNNPDSATIWSTVSGGRGTFGSYALSNVNGGFYRYNDQGFFSYKYYNDSVTSRHTIGYSSYRQYDSATPTNSKGFDAIYAMDGTITYKNYGFNGTNWYWTNDSTPAGFPSTWNNESPGTIGTQMDSVKPAGYISSSTGIKGKADLGYFLFNTAGTISSDIMESTSMTGNYISQTRLGTMDGSFLGASATTGATSGAWQGVGAGSWQGTPLKFVSNIDAFRHNLNHTGALTAGTAVATGSSYSVTVDPTGRFVYVANNITNTLSVYTIDQNTGELTAGAPVVAGTSPNSVVVDPTGRFAYVVNQNSNTVSVYTINQTTGDLTAGVAVGTGDTPASVAVDPSGRFAYVTNCSSNNVSVYTINQSTGALTAGTAVAAGTHPNYIAIDPTSKFAYVANGISNTVSVYTINQSTGALTATGSVATGNAPSTVSVDPTGRFAYVVNSNSHTVSVYTIDQNTGELTAGTAVGTGSSPEVIAVDPTGKVAYVTNRNSNTVSVYSINQNTGALTAAGAAVGTETDPYGIAVDPTGRYLYVVTYNSNKVSVFSIDSLTRTSDGSLTAYLGGTASLWNGGAAPVTMIGSYDQTGPTAFVWGQTVRSYNYLTGQHVTYDTTPNAYAGFMTGYKADDNTMKAKWASVYVKNDGSAGIHLGTLTGAAYPSIFTFKMDGTINAPIEIIAGGGIGFAPADLYPTNTSTASYSNGTPIINTGVFGGGGTIRLSYYQRDRVKIAGQDWGVWKSVGSGTYAGGTSADWSLSADHKYLAGGSLILGNELTGSSWSGKKLEATTTGYGSDITTGKTWVSIGETVGTFDPVALTFQAATAGPWIETDKFLWMVTNEQSKLQALNIPCVQVGSVNLTGSNTYVSDAVTGTMNVTMNNMKFFSNATGGPAKIWAVGQSQMGNWSHSYGNAPPPGLSANISGGGLNATFTVKTFDTVTNNNWNATITNGTGGFNGSTSFRGAATGTINTGAKTFSGTAAGVAK